MSSSIPYSKLKKRHNALSYHFVREAIASGMVRPDETKGLEVYSDADFVGNWDPATAGEDIETATSPRHLNRLLLRPLSGIDRIPVARDYYA